VPIKPLADLTEADLLSLIGVEQEGKVLEFKAQLALARDAERKEFLYDLSSFANASGGHIIFGMPEQGGFATGIAPIQVPDVDAEQLRIENIVRSGIAPRMSFSLRAVPVSPSGYVWVFHIPRSWSMPHMVTFQDSSRFYSRNSAGKYLVDVGELRALFARSRDVAETMRHFRIERTSAILAGEGPVRMADEQKLILHVYPFSAIGTPVSVDLGTVLHNNQNLMRPLGRTNGFGGRYNLDGVLSASPTDQRGDVIAYMQFYRDGRVEAVRSSELLLNPARRDLIDGPAAISAALVRLVERTLKLYEITKIEPPLAVFVTLARVKGCVMPIQYSAGEAIDRDVVNAPEVILESLKDNVAECMRPALDAIWNAAGYERCNFYDDAGHLMPDFQNYLDANSIL